LYEAEKKGRVAVEAELDAQGQREEKKEEQDVAPVVAVADLEWVVVERKKRLLVEVEEDEVRALAVVGWSTAVASFYSYVPCLLMWDEDV